MISPRINEQVKSPGKESTKYLSFRNEGDEAKYKAKGKIPIEVLRNVLQLAG